MRPSRVRRWVWVLPASVLAAMVATLSGACGSSGAPGSATSSFGDGGGTGSRKDGTTSGGGGEGGSLRGGEGGTTQPGDAGVDAPCAADYAATTLIPAYLIFIMDRSDSMGADDKWPACSAALETFFSDPSTAGISASLTFMPHMVDGGDGGHASCQASDYATPEVSMTALPAGATFKTVIAAEKLALGTPTRPALQGALKYAETIRAAHPGDKVLLVLATDGYPAGCSPDSVGSVADAASVASGKDGIPVYVIGVGDPDAATQGISNLDEIAAAGGTGKAFFIPTESGKDGGITAQAFLSAVKSIQATLSCEYAIPSPSGGAQIDYDKVNVVLTSNSKPTTVPYSAGCANPAGWDYVSLDGGTPFEITLCASACAQASSAGSGASMSVAFGCDTVGGVPH